MAGKTATVGITVTGAKAIQRAFKVLGETDAPFLRHALEQSGGLLTEATHSRAPGGMAATVAFVGVKGKGAVLRATVVVRHAGAKSMEFGRTWYYEGFTGRKMKATGQRVKRKGQQAKPFVGIIPGGHAIGAVEPKARELIEQAISKEWERIVAEGD